MSEDREQSGSSRISPEEFEALTDRVKNLEALVADKDNSKSGNSGWVTFFIALMALVFYRLIID